MQTNTKQFRLCYIRFWNQHFPNNNFNTQECHFVSLTHDLPPTASHICNACPLPEAHIFFVFFTRYLLFALIERCSPSHSSTQICTSFHRHDCTERSRMEALAGTRRAKWPSMALMVTLFLVVRGNAAGTSINGPIKTIVIVVMENRSFDHMLGWMKQSNPEIDGVNGQESNPVSTADPKSERVFFREEAEYVDPDPGHSFGAIRQQIFGSDDTSANPPPMNGFVQQATSMGPNMSHTVMNGFRPVVVPVYNTLVSEFAVVDRWFASVPASTQPNRLYVHSATSHGATSNIPKLLAAGYPQKTIFDSIDESGLSCGIYYQNIPATLFYKNLRKLKYVSNFHSYDVEFKRHAKQGKLPNYVVVEQRYMDTNLFPANDDHPSHDVSEGQKFVKEVYEALRSSPQWNQTLLLITYDEHGGFFDHFPTPVTNVPSPDGIVGPDPFFFNFDRLGVRVPTILVSPWINKGTVVHGPNGPYPYSQFEHSSIPATVKKMFNLKSDFLTKRDSWAGTFESVVQRRTLPRTDCPERLPEPPKIRKSGANEDAKLSEFQQELVQLAAQLNGDFTLKSYPDEIGKKMNVREGNKYIEDSVKQFFEASRLAKRLGALDDEIVKMRPSLTTRPTAPQPTSSP